MTAFLFLSFFGLHLFRAYPSQAPFRDAGDFSAAGTTLGIAHPPGYPLYVLTARAVQTLLPFGNPVYRLNLHSALSASGLAAFLFLLVSRWGGVAAGISGAVLISFFPPLLAQSGLTEVYVWNAFWASGLFWLAARPSGSGAGTDRRWLLAAFLAGVGLGNHQSLLFVLPALIFFVRKDRSGRLLDASFWFRAAAVFVLGVSVYLFLPFRAVAAEYLWGEPQRLKGLWEIITRADYGAGTLSTRYSTASAGAALMFWFQIWMDFWSVWGVLLTAAAGVWALRKDQRMVWGGGLWGLWVFTGPFFAVLARLEPGELSAAVLLPAMILPGLAAAAAGGLFLGWLFRRRFGRLAGGGVLAMLLLLKLVPAALGNHHRWNLVAVDYGRNLLRTFPPGAPLLMISDAAIFSVAHQQTAHRHRLDVRVLVDAELPWRWRRYRRTYPELFAEGQPDGGLALVKFQSGKTAVYTEGIQAKLLDTLCPTGMAARARWPRRDEACLDRIAHESWMWDAYVRRIPSSLTLLNDYYTRQILQTVSAGAFNAGLLLSQAGREEAARALYARALFWNPDRLLRWREGF